MPKNTKKCANKCKKGKNQPKEESELLFKGEMEEYAKVSKILGDGRFECECVDGVKRIGHICGKLRNKTFIKNLDLILISLREYEPEKCDIINKYKDYEVTKLKKAGEIPKSWLIPYEIVVEKMENDGIEFIDDKEEKEKKGSWGIDNSDKEECKEDEKDEEKENNEEKMEVIEDGDKNGEVWMKIEEEIKVKENKKKDKKEKNKRKKEWRFKERQFSNFERREDEVFNVDNI